MGHSKGAHLLCERVGSRKLTEKEFISEKLGGYGYIMICKSACTAISKAIRERDPHARRVTREGLVNRQDLFIFSVIREPWERLRSCYCNRILGTTAHQANWMAPFGLTNDIPWYRFLEIVIGTPDEEADDHWMSHWGQFNYNGIWIPQKLLLFERLDQDWSCIRDRLGTGPLKRANPTTIEKPEGTPKQKDQVRQKYQKDYELWERVRDGAGV